MERARFALQASDRRRIRSPRDKKKAVALFVRRLFCCREGWGRSGGEEGYLGGEEGRAAVAHAEGVAGGEGVHEPGDTPEVVVPVVD